MIECLEWRECERNTLQGFAKIRIDKWKLTIDGVCIFKKNGRSWASLPSRPQIGSDKRQIVIDGKPHYSRFLTFDSREDADQFSAAVCEAVARFISPSVAMTADDQRKQVAEAVNDSIQF